MWVNERWEINEAVHLKERALGWSLKEDMVSLVTASWGHVSHLPLWEYNASSNVCKEVGRCVVGQIWACRLLCKLGQCLNALDLRFVITSHVLGILWLQPVWFFLTLFKMHLRLNFLPQFSLFLECSSLISPNCSAKPFSFFGAPSALLGLPFTTHCTPAEPSRALCPLSVFPLRLLVPWSWGSCPVCSQFYAQCQG